MDLTSVIQKQFSLYRFLCNQRDFSADMPSVLKARRHVKHSNLCPHLLELVLQPRFEPGTNESDRFGLSELSPSTRVRVRG